MLSSDSAIIGFWQRIPVVIRDIIVGFLVFEIGVVVWVFIVGPFDQHLGQFWLWAVYCGRIGSISAKVGGTEPRWR